LLSEMDNRWRANPRCIAGNLPIPYLDPKGCATLD
jgi:hypothetical protein